MEQVIQNENLVMLQQKIVSYPKTYEDLKIIASIIRGTQIFNKLNELYHQQLSSDGQIKLCNNVEIRSYSQSELISVNPNLGVQLLLKGQVDVFQQEDGYIYKTAKLIASLFPLSYIEDEFHFGKQIYSSSQLKYKISVDDSLVLSINKQQCDDIYQFFGDLFLFKHKILCKIIPGLGELNSKRILAALATQFESLTFPHLTPITEENVIGDYLYFLAQGDISMSKNEEHIFNMEDNGIIGDELLIDPDSDQNQQLSYEFTSRNQSEDIHSSFPQLHYQINYITSQVYLYCKQTVEKQLMRLLMGSKPFDQSLLCNSPNNEFKKSQSTLILAKDSIKSYDKVDIQFQQYQVPKHSRVLKYNKNVLDQFGEEEKKSKKITMNEFVSLTKSSKEPQIKILEKVENPYSFASNVNSEGFLKQYYSNLIRVGLVKPPLRIAPQNHEAIQRSRVNSAVKLIEKTHKKIKTRKSTSLIYGQNDPILQINSLNPNKEDKGNTNSQKKLDKTRTITSFFATPRTAQQLHQFHNPSSGYFQIIETPKCETPESRSTMAKSSHVFRPYSGFMDHTSRLSQQSEMQKRLRKPNQHFF
ncbi:unnamed protein product (macronuclear) [Paramecium tetraurelia]|uniref:Cyclic nucleotide-binding domain-containing protein n=1 Tax=Paramecium tetraurelia TaxID=5888 RepID=A0C5D2_PARTE|nr:uncharacterized protein GSPATT00006498001 [Paramecium tetraurelia]CAK65999.1 unnamed protein product [Paramecium tetraurelia]|eukprot:XP_001433396.1 hypothetical protein (macronuclear) [Paramecium tetraurelia strain d4-2]